MPLNCAIAIDVDGTLIPVLVDFEKLRSEVRSILGVDHPLRPLGESLASLNVDEELRAKAWEAIERVELESLKYLNPQSVSENVNAVTKVMAQGYRVFIITMRSRKTARAVLDAIGLDIEEHYVVTRDESPWRLEQLRQTIEKAGARKLVFIGDTAHDEQVARALGVSFIRVQSYIDLPSAINKAVEVCKDP